MGPELLAGFAGRATVGSVGAFLLLCPMPMSADPDTSASSKLKISSKAIDATESHQNGKHLLGPSPGGEVARDDEAYDYSGLLPLKIGI